MDKIVTIKQAAEVLQLHPGSVWRMCKDGEIKHAQKTGGRWLINLTHEYPQLFGQEMSRSVPTNATARR